MSVVQSQTEFAAVRAEKRAGERSSAFLLAFIESEGGAWPVCLRNLSTTGALIESEAGFVLGSKVVFRRSFAAVPAEIVWRRGGRFGLTFERELDPQEVAALARRIPKRWPITLSQAAR